MALTLTTVTDDELRALEAPSVISERELAALEDEARELLTSQRPRRSSRILADTLADVEAPRPPRTNRRGIFGRSRKSVAPSPPAAARYAPSDSPPRRGRRSVMRGSIFQRFLGGGEPSAPEPPPEPPPPPSRPPGRRRISLLAHAAGVAGAKRRASLAPALADRASGDDDDDDEAAAAEAAAMASLIAASDAKAAASDARRAAAAANAASPTPLSGGSAYQDVLWGLTGGGGGGGGSAAPAGAAGRRASRAARRQSARRKPSFLSAAHTALAAPPAGGGRGKRRSIFETAVEVANLVEAGRRPMAGTAATAAPRRLSSLGGRQVDAAARLNATIASVAEEEEEEAGDGVDEVNTGAAGDDSDGEDFETVENKKARRALRLDHAVRQQAQTLWDTADTKLFRMRQVARASLIERGAADDGEGTEGGGDGAGEARIGSVDDERVSELATRLRQTLRKTSAASRLGIVAQEAAAAAAAAPAPAPADEPDEDAPAPFLIGRRGSVQTRIPRREDRV